MQSEDEVLSVLQQHLPMNKARLRLMRLLIMAVIKLQSVNLSKLAVLLNPRSQDLSNYRRLQRFLAEFQLDLLLLGKFLYALLPVQDNLIISIDRTEWKSGKHWVNILMDVRPLWKMGTRLRGYDT